MSYLSFCPEARKSVKVTRVNKSIRLEDAKVADFVDIEDIAEKAAFCRCWKSKNVRTNCTEYINGSKPNCQWLPKVWFGREKERVK